MPFEFEKHFFEVGVNDVGAFEFWDVDEISTLTLILASHRQLSGD